MVIFKSRFIRWAASLWVGLTALVSVIVLLAHSANPDPSCLNFESRDYHNNSVLAVFDPNTGSALFRRRRDPSLADYSLVKTAQRLRCRQPTFYAQDNQSLVCITSDLPY